MSVWTYVTGAIAIDTYSEEAIEKVEDFLSTAPKITGSERNVDIFINQPTGYNVSESRLSKDDRLVWDRYETRVIITLHGTLRDREIIETQKEVELFIQALEERFDIDYKSILVTD
jgi:hypothetical protein